jgi:hypothetical protein
MPSANSGIAGISPFFAKYLLSWISFCFVAASILLKDAKRLLPEWRQYAKFLFVPWKLGLFLPALVFVTMAGRYTDDETWDLVTGAGMAILTYLSAPWSVGLIYQVAIGKRPLRYLIVALALLFFSSSWFYDGYLLWRDGAYTRRWLGNLVLSPFIYVAAGLLWNLEAKEGEDSDNGWNFRFSFVRPDWPAPPIDTRFERLILVSIPFILVAIFILVSFVGWHFSLW